MDAALLMQETELSPGRTPLCSLKCFVIFGALVPSGPVRTVKIYLCNPAFIGLEEQRMLAGG